jgi:hypothetical protein
MQLASIYRSGSSTFFWVRAYLTLFRRYFLWSSNRVNCKVKFLAFCVKGVKVDWKVCSICLHFSFSTLISNTIHSLDGQACAKDIKKWDPTHEGSCKAFRYKIIQICLLDILLKHWHLLFNDILVYYIGKVCIFLKN